MGIEPRHSNMGRWCQPLGQTCSPAEKLFFLITSKSVRKQQSPALMDMVSLVYQNLLTFKAPKTSDPAILLLGTDFTYTQWLQAVTYTDIYCSNFCDDSKNWKQLKCPFIRDWLAV